MPKGTKADLSALLQKHGFYYSGHGKQNIQRRTYVQHKHEFYKSKSGEVRRLKLIKEGKSAKWLPRPQGATSWLARTAATADTYVIQRKRR